MSIIESAPMTALYVSLMIVVSQRVDTIRASIRTALRDRRCQCVVTQAVSSAAGKQVCGPRPKTSKGKQLVGGGGELGWFRLHKHVRQRVYVHESFH